MSTHKKNVLYNLLLTLSNILFPIVTFPYVSRVLGPDGIGKAQFVITFAQYFALIAALGIPLYGIREVAKVKADKKQLSQLVMELLTINFITTLILAACYMVMVLFIPKFSQHLSLHTIGLGLLLLGFTSIDWFYTGTEKFKFVAYRSVIIKALSMLLLFAFVKKAEDVPAYLSITVFSMVANNVWNMISLRREIVFERIKLQLKKHLIPLLTIFSTTLSISIYTVMDTLLLGLLSNDTAVGLYTAAVKLNRVCLPFIVAYGTVIMPQIVQSLHQQQLEKATQHINKSFAYVAFIGVPVSLGLFLFAKEFVLLFSGSDFVPATITMQIMSVLPLLIGLNNIFGTQILTSAGQDKSLFVSVTAGMLVSLIFNLIAIPFLQEKGAALATLVAEVVVTSLTYYFVKKKLNISINYGLLVKAFLASTIFVPIAYILQQSNLSSLLILIIGVPICFVIYIGLQLWVFKNKLIQTILNDLLKRKHETI